VVRRSTRPSTAAIAQVYHGITAAAFLTSSVAKIQYILK